MSGAGADRVRMGGLPAKGLGSHESLLSGIERNVEGQRTHGK
ncbi:hypothetical protein C7S16_5489 [Burkholderia thailandensis]|uniref:Uncharacterized protein n=1 Tax=Burkholderia thailandensis TaxID=57975 RepID=A0AAW9CUL3_BURTH|nr:hypothetical protein [Burkholderia thailandensis]MDW9252723.1 hypothetical protein [Burkholderia thailandensis]